MKGIFLRLPEMYVVKYLVSCDDVLNDAAISRSVVSYSLCPKM
jgi:hypothetical protein